MFRQHTSSFNVLIALASLGLTMAACQQAPEGTSTIDGDDWTTGTEVALGEPSGSERQWVVTLDLAHFELDSLPPRNEHGYVDTKWAHSHRQGLALAKQSLIKKIKLPPSALARRYETLSSMALRMTPAQAQQLSNTAGVKAVMPDELIVLDAQTSLPFMGIEVDSDGVNVDPSAGDRTTVAVIDTAARYWLPDFGLCGEVGAPLVGREGCRLERITNHTDCETLARFAPGWECKDGGGDYDEVAQNTLHGSNVAGIVSKVAPGAGIWALNVAHLGQLQSDPRQERLWIFLTDIIDALNTINAEPGGVVSVNMSLGSSRAENSSGYCAGALGSAVESLWEENGIVVVVSSGNDATKNALGSPACEPYVVSVGAHYDTQNVGHGVNFSNCSDPVINEGEVTCFSNSQASLDIVAPGGFVRAGGTSMSGTSQASPHVAGFVALLQSQALQSPTGSRYDPASLVTLLRSHAGNHREVATGLDGRARNWTHRRLDAQAATAHDQLHVLFGDPKGLSVAPGSSRAVTLDISGARQVLKTWLDVEVEHPETADLSLALVSPGNKRFEVSGEGGANLHQLLGLQSNVAILGAFESERVGGSWRLEVTNRSQTATAKLMRAVLMFETRSATSPPSIESFDFDESSVVADGQELQTLRMRLANASAVGEIRLLINRPDHSENGRSYDGYIRMDPSQCVELGSGFGNDRIALDETRCSWSQRDEFLEVAVSLAFESDFGAASNNQVSVLLLDEDNAQLSAWTRASATGSGFAVTAGPAQPPASFGSFHFGAPTVLGNGADVQSLHLSINSGAQIDSVRFMINHPSHAQDNLLQRGYFLASREGCREVTSRYGNDVVTLIEGGCSLENQEDGSVRVVVPFAVEPDFGVSVNNQVSAIWYAGGVQQVGWRRVSEPGLGFSVQMTDIQASLAYDQPTVVANGVQLQTLRLTLTEAAQVDDLRLMINHPVHAENDNAPGGYFQFTDEGCREFTRQYGNPVVELRQDLCKRREVSPGVFEYVLRMTFGPNFSPSTNNQVSALWFENGVPRVGWRRLTPREEGFEVVGVEGPVEVESFTVEESQLRSDGLEVQTFRLLLTNAASVDAVEMMINRPGHSVNGRENDGHFLVSAQGCEQRTGQGTVTLLHDACGLRRHFDSTVEFSVSLVVEEAYGASDQNTVSGMWAGGDWSEMTAGDGRFDVVSP